MLSQPGVWHVLDGYFNSKSRIFPCLYAISSFNKGMMRIRSVINYDGLDEVVAKDLRLMSQILSTELGDDEKKLITYLIVVVDCNAHGGFSDRDFLINLLLHLRAQDCKPWPLEKTKNLNDHGFEFCFHGCVWFPVILSPWHRSDIRRAPFFMIAIQPGATFDFNKSSRARYYNNMRTSIHRRIDKFYNEGRPYYLSSNSSGKNICQYIGYDELEDDPNYIFPCLE